jgi:hypothetical protein
MGLLSHMTRAAYGAARFLNKARVVSALAKGNSRPLEKYTKNRILYRIFGKLLR